MARLQIPNIYLINVNNYGLKFEQTCNPNLILFYSLLIADPPPPLQIAAPNFTVVLL
jgi:hypothetical protein